MWDVVDPFLVKSVAYGNAFNNKVFFVGGQYSTTWEGVAVVREDHTRMNFVAQIQNNFHLKLMTVTSYSVCPPINCDWGRRLYIVSRSTSTANLFKLTFFEIPGGARGDFNDKRHIEFTLGPAGSTGRALDLRPKNTETVWIMI